MRLPKVAVFCGKQLNGVSLWRSVRPWSDLMRIGVVDVDFFYQTFNEQDTYLYDVVYIAHAASEQFLKLIDSAHMGGAAVWVDLDDDLLNIPDHNQQGPTIKKEGESLKKILQSADIVSFSTEEIKAKYDAFVNCESVVLPNSVHMGELREKWNNGERVLWRGNYSQLRDMYCNIRDQDKLIKHGMKIAYIGAPPPWIDSPAFMEWGPAHSYFANLRKTMATYFWKPLENIEFNKGKSNITMLEGAMCGALTITNFNKEEKWRPAISAEEAVDRSDEWKNRRYADMLDFVNDKYNSKKVGELRYQHLVTALNK